MATVDIPPSLLSSLKSFRLSKRSSSGSGHPAMVIKIDKKMLVMGEEEVYERVELEELVDELPENSPRFVVLSYQLNHKDGRVSYPLVLINWAPTTSSMELATLYASALSNFSVQSDVSKVVDIRDGELTKEILDERLGA